MVYTRIDILFTLFTAFILRESVQDYTALIMHSLYHSKRKLDAVMQILNNFTNSISQQVSLSLHPHRFPSQK